MNMGSTEYVGSGLVDFVIDIPEGRSATILQLTDIQIIDASQARTPNRLKDEEKLYWAPELMEQRCFRYLRELIPSVSPDLILISGDLVYGEFDDKGTSFLALIRFLDSFGIPWAPVFGNHDNDCAMGADWQCAQLTASRYCRFLPGKLSGKGNFTVGLRQGGKLIRVFFLLDSNGAIRGTPGCAFGFAQDQIDWYTTAAKAISAADRSTGLSFVFHVQPAVFALAFAKYGFTNHGTALSPISIDDHPLAVPCDFGYLGADLKNSWDLDFRIWNSLKVLGVDSIFVGHEHCNSASVVYEGIRCQYGQKSSTYDRANYRTGNTIVGSFTEAGIPIVGGTVFSLAADGTIRDARLCLVSGK